MKDENYNESCNIVDKKNKEISSLSYQNEATETIQYDFIKPTNLPKTSKKKAFFFTVTLLIIIFGVFLIIFKKQGYNFLIKDKDSLEYVYNIKKKDYSKDLIVNKEKENFKDKGNIDKKNEKNKIENKINIKDKNKKEKQIKRKILKEKITQTPFKLKK